MKNQSLLQFHSHHGLLVLLLLLVLLSSSFTTLEARFLTSKQGLESGVDGLLQMSDHVVKNIEAEDSLDLMGMEDHCGNGDEDEECLQRRMIAEAHLDYIYTQHHKP